MISWLRHLIGWGINFFRSRGGLLPENPGPPPVTPGFAHEATSPATQCSAQVVLDRVAKALGWLEKAADSGYTQNRGWVASRGVSPVLADHLPGAQAERTEAGEQRGSRLDLPHGCLESNGGSAPHPWRAAQAGLRYLRTIGLTMASARAASARSGPAVADIFAESSRSHCRDGLLHGADAHLWRLVLLLCDRS